MRLVSVALPILALCLCAGCPLSGVKGSGAEATDERKVEAFSAIELGGAYRAEVTVGEPRSVVISGDDNVVPLISTAVDNGTLKVKSEKSYSSSLPLHLRVVTPTLTAVHISGAASVEASGIKADRFTVRASGAARVTLSGKADELIIKSTGAGDIKAGDLEAQRVDLSLSGAGKAVVHAVKTLKAGISGAASVRYKGAPEVEQKVTGVGSVKPL